MIQDKLIDFLPIIINPFYTLCRRHLTSALNWQTPDIDPDIDNSEITKDEKSENQTSEK